MKHNSEMFSNLLKNYMTVCEITMQASLDSVDCKCTNYKPHANTKPQEGVKVQHSNKEGKFLKFFFFNNYNETTFKTTMQAS